MLSFASICPHPPIIVPGIGRPEDLAQVKSTISAMKKLVKKLEEAEPDTIIIISPHALVHWDRMTVYGAPKFSGDFGHFGAPDISFRFDNDLILTQSIVEKANKQGISTILFGDPESDYQELDHGEMVPLYYLTKNLKKSTKIVVIAYSMLDRLQHFAFGQVINEVCSSDRFINQSIAVVASGDLSHRLISGAPAGYSEAGKEFDEELVKYIKENQVREILEMDPEFVEDAGECGYRSIVILLGLLNGLNYNPKVFSYEGPFGVGYLVTNFQLAALRR